MIRDRPDPSSVAWVSPRVVQHRSGQRGTAMAGLQLYCQVGEYELEILAQSAGEELRIFGLATSGQEPAADLRIELFDSSAERPHHAVTTNAFGEFDFEAPPGGRWALRVGDDPYTPRVRLWEVLE